jgi:two-component system response regulator DesR
MAYLLARDLEVEFVEEASTLAEARVIALENLGAIDVVVSELSLPDGEATDFLVALREVEADASVLVLTFRGDRPSRDRALELGAARVMSKDAPAEEIFAAIRELGGLEDD